MTDGNVSREQEAVKGVAEGKQQEEGEVVQRGIIRMQLQTWAEGQKTDRRTGGQAGRSGLGGRKDGRMEASRTRVRQSICQTCCCRR